MKSKSYKFITYSTVYEEYDFQSFTVTLPEVDALNEREEEVNSGDIWEPYDDEARDAWAAWERGGREAYLKESST